MKVQFDNPHGNASMQQLEELESRLGITFPESYRQFLLESNGGIPTPDGFSVPGWRHQASIIDQFFGIYTNKSYSLEREIERYRDRLPIDIVPIANDQLDNLVCLGVKRENRGKIYFWDYEDELDEQGCSKMDYSNVYVIADDIYQFIERLFP